MVLMPLEIGGREYQSIRGIATLDDTSHRLVVQAIDILADCGPAERRQVTWPH